MASTGRESSSVAAVLWTLLLKLQRIVMLVGIIVTASAIMLEVIMRYVFRSSIVGIEEFAAYLSFWIYFTGAAYGTYERSHVKADISHLLLKKRTHYAILKFCTSLISSGVVVYVVPWAWRYTLWGFHRNEQSISTLFDHTYPVVYFQSSILFGLVLMGFYFLVETIQWAHPLVTRTDVPDELMKAREEIKSWI
jgi:TRAP-type transport system small permease protein